MQRVIYEIEQDKEGQYRIMESVDFNIYDYREEFSSSDDLKKFAVLENLQSAKFEFYRADKEKWESTWDSEGAYVQDESRFPSVVAIEFEIVDPADEKNVRKWRSEFAPILSLNASLKQKVGR